MTGVDRVAENIISRLDAIWPIARWGRYTVAVPPGAHRAISLRNGDIVSCGRRKGVAWEQLDLPRAHGDSLILNLCNTAPLRHSRNLVLIHDAHVFDYPDSY